MEYVKIHSLWKREGFDQQKTPEGNPVQSKKYNVGDLIIGDYAIPEFGSIKCWRVEEKVDGVNTRVEYKNGKLSFAGRKYTTQLPPFILNYLKNTFYDELFFNAFKIEENQQYPDVVLYGECYGPQIQKNGAKYRDDVGFILFDVMVNGWMYSRENVKLVSKLLKIDMVPQIGWMTESEIIEFVKSKPDSRCSKTPQMMEGIVARAYYMPSSKEEKTLMFKLKCKDFI